MRGIKQFLFYYDGEGRAGGLLHEADNLAMIVRLTELIAAVTQFMIFERLEDRIHIRRYFLKGASVVYFSTGQRLILDGLYSS